MARIGSRGVLSFMVNATEVDVTITSSGVFEATGPNAQIYTDKSFEGLKRKVRDAYRLTGKIQIPATLYNEGKAANPDWDEAEQPDVFEPVMITGRNLRSRQLSIVNGDNEASTVYGTKDMLRRLEPQEAETLERLRKQRDASEVAFRKYHESLQLDVDAALTEAMASTTEAK